VKTVLTRPITGAEEVNWRTNAGRTLVRLTSVKAMPKQT